MAHRPVAVVALGVSHIIVGVHARAEDVPWLERWARPQNPSCWTDGYTYETCCGSEGPAPGCFDNDNLQDPHSWERCCTSPCGAALRARINVVGRAHCAGKGHWNDTVVSGLWNLRRDQWAPHARYKEGASRAYARYLDWLDGLLKKRQALLLFLDAEAAAFAIKRRKQYGLSLLTCVLEVPMEDLPQMRWREGYLAAHQENRRKLPEDKQPEVMYADYTLVVNSKPELLACAALWDPFRSSTFAWVDAGSGRKSGFPSGVAPLRLPPCGPWSLCVARRMWLFCDFRSKIKRLEHGSTFDSTVLLGGGEAVLMYALWFQWAISRYLAEKIMDDEQSVIAEVWWAGRMEIQSFYGMQWEETLSQMVDWGLPGHEHAPDQSSIDIARKMGHWFGRHPSLIYDNGGNIWVPFAENLQIVEQVPVNEVSDVHLERLAYSMWCLHKKYGYYATFCEHHINRTEQLEYHGFDNLPVVTRGNGLVQARDFK